VPPTSKQCSEPTIPRPEEQVRQPVLILPNQAMSHTNPDFVKATELKVKDANFSPVTILFISPALLLSWLIRFYDTGRTSRHPSKVFLCPYFRKFQRCSGEFAWQETHVCRRFFLNPMWVRIFIPCEPRSPFYLLLSFSCAIGGLSARPISELPSRFFRLCLCTVF